MRNDNEKSSFGSKRDYLLILFRFLPIMNKLVKVQIPTKNAFNMFKANIIFIFYLCNSPCDKFIKKGIMSKKLYQDAYL